MTKGNGNGRFLTRERVLFGMGVATFVFELINAEVLNRPFHPEFLLASLALCGVAITQWVDRK